MILFARLSREQAETYRLVCAAEELDCRLVRTGRCWQLHVPVASSQRARRVIALYTAENPVEMSTPAIPDSFSKPSSLSGIVPAAILASVFAATGPRGSSTVFVDRYGADAARILDGEVYRTVTALLLHGDVAHLAGNCAGLVVFGAAVAHLAGWGTAWLMILMAGGMGNYANALFYQFGHRSIGASTAVFGAVGILASLQALERRRQHRGHFGGWLPIAAGLGLLAFFGASPFSDVMAHLFGFAAGLLVAAAAHALLPRVRNSGCQAVFLAGTMMVLAWCWTAAW